MPSSSQQTPQKGKKRKSMAAESAAEGSAASSSDVKVVVAESSSSAGPVWVNFPSVRPAKTTPFTIYTREPESDLELGKQSTIIAGETEDVEYCSINRLRTPYREPGDGEGGDCQYVPALYDRATSTLHIHPSAPLYLLTHSAKRLRMTNAEAGGSGAALRGQEYKLKRNDLGDTFGTKKAKSQIKAEERNKVDVSAMQGVKTHLIDSIGVRPEASELNLDPEPSEFIPRPDLEATEPSGVYTRDAIIPQDEYSAISVSELLRAKDDDAARVAALPYRRSRWVEAKARTIAKGPADKRKEGLKMLYYLALLLQFNASSGAVSKMPVAELSTKLFSGVPPQLLNGLLTRFAEQAGKKYQVTEKTKTKLLAWICTLYLYLDHWSIEVAKVAQDLSMTDAKVANMFKSLGCSIDLPTTADRQAAGMSLADAQKKRRAVLKAPVKFPKTKRRGPVKR